MRLGKLDSLTPLKEILFCILEPGRKIKCANTLCARTRNRTSTTKEMVTPNLDKQTRKWILREPAIAS